MKWSQGGLFVKETHINKLVSKPLLQVQMAD